MGERVRLALAPALGKGHNTGSPFLAPLLQSLELQYSGSFPNLQDGERLLLGKASSSVPREASCDTASPLSVL